ncbi:TonB family protein [Acinetobacter rudis]|uniref:TonB family protein n=1 Tax=Acinetobacter rudis TaxID=632955 RepID=UPI00334083CB
MKRILLAICLSVFCLGASAKVEEVAKLDVKNVEWDIKPYFRIANEDLEGYDRDFSIYFEADVRGVITHARISKSSGLQVVDEKALQTFKKSRIKPYEIDGVVYPISATQPFFYKASRKAQFETKPKIIVKRSLLWDDARTVGIYAEADENGNITKAEVYKSSRVPELDEYVLSEYKRQVKFKPLSVNGQSIPITDLSWFYFSEKVNSRN